MWCGVVKPCLLACALIMKFHENQFNKVSKQTNCKESTLKTGWDVMCEEMLKAQRFHAFIEIKNKYLLIRISHVSLF